MTATAERRCPMTMYVDVAVDETPRTTGEIYRIVREMVGHPINRGNLYTYLMRGVARGTVVRTEDGRWREPDDALSESNFAGVPASIRSFS